MPEQIIVETNILLNDIDQTAVLRNTLGNDTVLSYSDPSLPKILKEHISWRNSRLIAQPYFDKFETFVKSLSKV